MRVRSEWLTLITVTALAAGALLMRGGGSPAPVPVKRPDVAAAGIDFTPVGAIHPLTGDRAAGKGTKPHAKPTGARP